MSFLLTLAHFSLQNVKGMSRISKLCLGAKPQVSWIKTLKFFTIPIKMLRDLYSSASSDVSKYRRYPSHEGRTLITVFDFSLGNCTPPHWAEQSLWHTRSSKTFCFSVLNAMRILYGKRKTGKGKIHKGTIRSVWYTNCFLSSVFIT